MTMVNQEEHESFIRQAIELAREARANGDHPFGALLVKDGVVLKTAVNTVNTQNDPTHHAELNLVSASARQFDADTLAQSILYTSTEPCAMCAGAIFWAGISTIIYSCAGTTLGDMTGGLFVVPSRELLAKATRPTTVIGPILEAEGIAVHEGFWQ
ncbi:MAG: nucleoside deaminase [Chloroflexota bacterium]